MFAVKTNENRRLYRYPTQPNPSCLLETSNILQEVTNSYEQIRDRVNTFSIVSSQTSQENLKLDQKENGCQHINNPSVVIKNTNQSYNKILDAISFYNENNISQSHSHSNSMGSTVSHVRSASDADSVVYLGPEDTSRTDEIQSNNKSISQSSWEDIRVNNPIYKQNLKQNQIQQLQRSNSSRINSAKSQKSPTQLKGDDTFNLSVSGEIMPSFPTILISESQNISMESLKNKSQITTVPTQYTTGNTNEINITDTASNNSPNKLFIFCPQCKCLAQAEIYSAKKDQKFKSGMLSLIIEVMCCMNNNNKNLSNKKYVGFRCYQCKQNVSRVDDVAANLNY